ncbi:thiol peroxidase [Ornithinimicrobium panacihumi]|uniref:thiol peroxidase n=1 Tax=Ornithinimicrobium panacihumi TaxID=2008449 RepID=UPI003F8A598C
MATITFKGNPLTTAGELPSVGSEAPSYTLVGTDMGEVTSDELAGRRVILNIFPSLDTGTCAASVRKFNELAAGLDNTTVVCASQDLPFAQARFCGAEGIENVTAASAFRSSFGEDYGVKITDGRMEGLLARAVVVVDETGKVVYTQLVDEVTEEPDYDAALAALN